MISPKFLLDNGPEDKVTFAIRDPVDVELGVLEVEINVCGIEELDKFRTDPVAIGSIPEVGTLDNDEYNSVLLESVRIDSGGDGNCVMLIELLNVC